MKHVELTEKETQTLRHFKQDYQLHRYIADVIVPLLKAIDNAHKEKGIYFNKEHWNYDLEKLQLELIYGYSSMRSTNQDYSYIKEKFDNHLASSWEDYATKKSEEEILQELRRTKKMGRRYRAYLTEVVAAVRTALQTLGHRPDDYVDTILNIDMLHRFVRYEDFPFDTHNVNEEYLKFFDVAPFIDMDMIKYELKKLNK